MTGITSVTIVLLIVLYAGGIFGAVLFSRNLKKLRKEKIALEKRIVSLEKRVETQQAELNAQKQALATASADPLIEIFETVTAWKTRGTIPTLVSLGVRLFKSYSQQRKTKALPSKSSPK